jgi:MFS family permease
VKLRLLLGISVFWLGLSMVSDGVTTLVLPARILSIGNIEGEATILGLLTFIGLILGMLIQPIVGLISDRLRPRWGRRSLIAVGVVALVLSLAGLAFLPGILGLCLAYLLLQFALSTAQAGQQGFIPDLVPAQKRGLASGFKGFMDIGGAMLGFVLLGQLLGSGRLGLALLILAATVTLTFLLTLLMVREDVPNLSSKNQSENHVTFLDAFRLDLHQHRRFARLVLSRFLFLLGTYAIGRFLLLFIASRLGLSTDQAAREAGTALAVLSLLTVLSAPIAGWAADRVGRTPLMIVGAGLSAVGAILLIFAGNVPQILLFGALMAAGSAAFSSGNWAMIADLVPPSESARFFGLANFGTAGAAAMAGLFGLLVDGANHFMAGLGYPSLFFVSAIVFVASALVLERLTSIEKRAERYSV